MSAPVAKRYARALFSLTSSNGNFETASRELGVLVATFRDRELAAFASRATVDRKTKRAVAARLVDRLGVSPLMRSFLVLLAEKNRLGLLGEIEKAYQKLADHALGQVRARIRCAASPSSENVRQLRELFERKTGKQVLAEVVVEPELLGGAIVEIQGRIYDGSVKTQLEEMRAALAG